MGFLYRLDFPNGKSYVGITVKTAEHRFKYHADAVKRGSELLVHCAWRKYGTPTLVTLAQIEDFDLNATEIRAVSLFNTKVPNGYNLTDGGDGIRGFKHSDDTKKKMSLASSGRPKSIEHCANLRLSHLGYTHSEVSKAKVSASLIGNTRSVGYKHTDEAKAKISAANRGRPAANKGVPASPEHRRKISEGLQRHYATKPKG